MNMTSSLYLLIGGGGRAGGSNQSAAVIKSTCLGALIDSLIWPIQYDCYDLLLSHSHPYMLAGK